MPKLCVIPGDGIGKEVIPVAVQVLRAVIPDLEITWADAGWETFQKTGASVPESTLEQLRVCGAGLFGAVASPSHKVAGYQSSILKIRRAMDLYANIRPIYPLPNVSPRLDVDLVVIRENSEGLYVGIERSDGETAVAERRITRRASERIAKVALRVLAKKRRKKLTLVHKANVLPLTDGLFRETVLAQAQPWARSGSSFQIDELLVDVAALKVLAEPETLDVLITPNLYGDILSDAASHWMGGLGLAPSLNLGDEVAVAEPVHGSAPDIAGLGIANPLAAILSTVLLLRFVWEREAEAVNLEGAVRAALKTMESPKTADTKTLCEAVLANVPARSPLFVGSELGKPTKRQT